MSGGGSQQQNNPTVTGQGYAGQAGPSSARNRFNQTAFLIQQHLAKNRWATLVRIESCTKSSAVDVIGFVTVTPLVYMVDGVLNTYPHGIVNNLAYTRVAGGQNAIIMDPQKGDLGIAVIADRDISVIKKTLAPGPPGSGRRGSLSDGIYLFPVLCKNAPTQYIRFVQDNNGNPNGIEMVDALGNYVKTSPNGIVAHDKNNNVITMDTNGINATDKNSNVIAMVSSGIQINGVLFDRSQNVSAINNLTNTGTASLGGGSQAVKLASGANATKVTAT